MPLFRCLLLLALILAACTPQSTPTGPTPTARPLPTVAAKIVRAPDARAAAQGFLAAWKATDYKTMHTMLTRASQDAVPQSAFIARFQDTARQLTQVSLDYQILSATTNPESAQVAYNVTYHTTLVGDITNQTAMNLSLEDKTWRVQWDDGLILPALRGGNKLELKTSAPVRGNIYDRTGQPIAIQTDATAFGVVAADGYGQYQNWALGLLSDLTGRPAEYIRLLYDNDKVYPGVYVPVGEAARTEIEDYDNLNGVSWLNLNDYSGRFYYYEGVAPHVTGYVRTVQKGEEEKYQRKGYTINDRVAETGVEEWADSQLRGQPAVLIDVKDPQGNTVTRLAQVDAKPAQSINLTIDRDLQVAAQQAISGFTGAIVVLERDTGRVLAMVSSPGFDPNAFEINNVNSSSLVQQYNQNPEKPYYNRASGRGYAPGSVFKIITLAAALESGIFTPESTYDCQYEFTELPDRVLYDWTKEKGLPPSGMLTLPQALMRSCDPWFYKIGMELYRQDRGNDLSNMARAFGMGSPTGIGAGLDDDPGSVHDPSEEFDAVQMAIGQSKLLTNPLQVARFVAAVGNGGNLYRPQVIEKIADPDGKASFTFQPEIQSTLPVKPENLKVIQEAMGWVVQNKRGTVPQVFSGFSIPVFGKTGTAESDYKGSPHAWFAGYTNARREGKPDVAFAVVAEYAGEGSEIAAPIARRVLEYYFLGKAQRVYTWETRVNVPRPPTPTPEVTGQPSSPANPGQPNPQETGPDFSVRTATPSP